jgi:hypothetical protein
MKNPSLQDEKAHQILNSPENYPGLVRRGIGERRLLMWRDPAFEASVSWAVFSNQNESWVRRIIWDRSLRFPSHDAEPYTYGSEVSLPHHRAKELVDSLSAISLRPLQQPQWLGLDGVTCGIEVGNYSLSCRLIWWYVPSSDWQPLMSWFDDTQQYFEEILPDHTDQMK